MKRICASSWTITKNHCMMHGQQNVKRMCFNISMLMHKNKELCISWPIRHTTIFSLGILEKNNDECILILVIFWKKTGLLQTKISNHNVINSSQKPRKSSSLSLKSSSWLFSLDVGMGTCKFGNNTYPRRIRCRSNLGHIFREKKCILRAGKYGIKIKYTFWQVQILNCVNRRFQSKTKWECGPGSVVSTVTA